MSLKKLFEYIANPRLLRRLNRYLLLNQPVIWGSKVHYVMYYGLLANLLVVFVSVLAIGPKQIDEFINSFTLLLIILEVPAFFFWMFRQSIFDVDKQHGQTTEFYKRSILETLVYALCCCLIFSPSVIAPTVAVHNIGYEQGIKKSTSCGSDQFSRLFEGSSNNLEIMLDSDRRKEISSEICLDIQFITTGFYSYSHNRNGTIDIDKSTRFLAYYEYLISVLIIASTACWPFFIAQKYAGWPALAWLGLCLVVLASLTIPTFVILSRLSLRFMDFDVGDFIFSGGNNGDICIVTFVVLLISFLKYMKISKQKSYDASSVISFSVFLLSINLMMIVLIAVNIHTNSAYDWIPPFSILCFSYFLFYPLYKKLLIKNSFLPRKK
jgi:hypothetical protein